MNKLKIKFSENKYIKIGRGEKLSFILGPCAIENEHHALKMAEKITSICQKKNVNYIYKSCYDKDCRSSINSFHGVGLNEGLKILSKIRENFNVPVTSDFSVHTEAKEVSSVCDLIQIDSDFELTNMFIINKAYPADKKSFPISWLVVFLSTFSILIASKIILLCFELYNIQKNDK